MRTGKVERDFTVFVSEDDYRANKRWLLDADDPLSFDGEGAIKFGEVSDPKLNGRIHAVSCFDRKYRSVTLRSFKMGNTDAEAALWSRLNPEPKPKLEELDLAYNAALPEDEVGWDPKQYSLERAPQLCDLLFRHCLEESSGMPAGLVLFSGGTGTGKTTYLNGLLRRYLVRYRSNINKRRPHLVSIGDPIETFLFEELSKHLAGSKLERIAGYQCQKAFERPFDFTARVLKQDTPSVKAALKDALRETPCAVVVSELREDEDFKAALDFAATGHLILASSHSTTLADAIGRLFDIYKAKTPADRAEVANRVHAVIHHKVLETKDGIKLNVPSVWRGTPEGRRNLIADGLSSLVGRAPSGVEPGACGVLGRYWWTKQLHAGEDYLKWTGEDAESHGRKRNGYYSEFLEQALRSDLHNR
jgi:hypothetical protein